MCTCYKHHIGENSSSTIKEVLEAYEIAGSVVGSVAHEQGSNMSGPLICGELSQSELFSSHHTTLHW